MIRRWVRRREGSHSRNTGRMDRIIFSHANPIDHRRSRGENERAAGVRPRGSLDFLRPIKRSSRPIAHSVTHFLPRGGKGRYTRPQITVIRRGRYRGFASTLHRAIKTNCVGHTLFVTFQKSNIAPARVSYALALLARTTKLFRLLKNI